MYNVYHMHKSHHISITNISSLGSFIDLQKEHIHLHVQVHVYKCMIGELWREGGREGRGGRGREGRVLVQTYSSKCSFQTGFNVSGRTVVCRTFLTRLAFCQSAMFF